MVANPSTCAAVLSVGNQSTPVLQGQSESPSFSVSFGVCLSIITPVVAGITLLLRLLLALWQVGSNLLATLYTISTA